MEIVGTSTVFGLHDFERKHTGGAQVRGRQALRARASYLHGADRTGAGQRRSTSGRSQRSAGIGRQSARESMSYEAAWSASTVVAPPEQNPSMRGYRTCARTSATSSKASAKRIRVSRASACIAGCLRHTSLNCWSRRRATRTLSCPASRRSATLALRSGLSTSRRDQHPNKISRNRR